MSSKQESEMNNHVAKLVITKSIQSILRLTGQPSAYKLVEAHIMELEFKKLAHSATAVRLRKTLIYRYQHE
jgi:hypothetical protein